uniref:DNA 5'-3' helicase n=1 Tax=Megaselia scalaris TaxID=36166 RepID=T1GBR3_MEGSC
MNYYEIHAPTHTPLTGLVLSSRKNMCVHPEVSKEREGKSVDGKCFGLTASYIRDKHEVDPEIPVCQYYEGFSIEGKEMKIPDGIYSLDDLKEFGRQRNWCPYFTARYAIVYSQIVVYSYHYLLDPKIAEVVSKEMNKESVIIFDEAHNIDNVCIDSMSVKINKRVIERSTAALNELQTTVQKMRDADINKLNEEYQRMVQGLKDARIRADTDMVLANPILPKDILKELQTQFDEIEGSLTLDSKHSSRIKSALASRIHATECVDFEIEKIRQFEQKLANKILECDSVIKEVSPNLKNVQHLQQLIEYMRIIKDIQDINNGLTSALNGKDETKIVSLYLSLFGDCDSRNCVVGRLQEVDAVNLKSYAVKTSAYWFEIIQDRFSNDFETVLKNIKYGLQGYDLLNLAPSKDNLNKLSVFSEYLFLIKSPIENPDSLVTITPCIVCPSISKVTEILLRPFR